MTQEDFLQQLASALSSLGDMERARVLDYYREMICDRTENGEEEAAVVNGFGSASDIAAQILTESRTALQAEPERGPAADAAPAQAASAAGNPYAALGTVHSIVVNARHIAVEVRGVTEGCVQVHFNPGESDRVACTEQDGIFTFQHSMRISLFHWQDLFMGPRKVVVDVPVSFDGTLTVSTCNARLDASGLSHVADTRFSTSNAAMRLRGILCGALHGKTSNGAIDLQNAQGAACTLETSNGRITAENAIFPQALQLYTSNGAVRMQSVVSDHLEFSTQNAAVSGTIVGDMRDYAVRSHTSNASNNLPPELVYPEQSKELNVNTSNAKIDVRFIAGQR